VRHTPDGKDLVLDDFAPLGEITVDGRSSRPSRPIRALHEFLLRAYIQHCCEHVRNCQPPVNDRQKIAREKRKGRTLLADEWQAPAERVHEVGQPVRVRHIVELSDAEHVRLVLDHCSLVIVHVQVVWCREEGHDAREPRLAALAIHPVPARRQTQPNVRWETERTQRLEPHARG
jgi:hypothetical protein